MVAKEGMARDLTGLVFAAGMLLAWLGARQASSHPAHAKPVNYPFVVGFERFHGSLDDEDYLAEGGFLLLNELNCVACHAPPAALAAQFPGIAATSLAGVASRLAPVEIELFVRNPRFAKRDTTMPSLFAGPDRDLDEVAALRAWLATLVEEIPDHPVGEVEAGRVLYHRIGCVACHAPEAGYRPPGIPENAEIELAGLPSVPMNLADFYDYGALVEFLLDPNRHRPSGRMPDFGLSPGQARDLAAYLKAGPDLVLPENLTEALAVPDAEADPVLIARGRGLFLAKSCHACHALPDGADGADGASGSDRVRAGPSARPLADLAPGSADGCLSERPEGGAMPFYGLDAVQRRAIAAALRRLPDRAPLPPAQDLEWRMKQLNCYACHERDGIGGPETSREAYFGFALPEAVAMGRWGHLPPALDGIEKKLTEDWLRRVLGGEGRPPKVRPGLATDMPRFRHETVAPILEVLLSAADKEANGKEAVAPSSDEARAARLFAEESCSRCHSPDGARAKDWPGIDLGLAPRRLRRPYFDEALASPGEHFPAVPKPAVGDKADAEALWRWLGRRAKP
jgi:mono/diheme cytochrome c family protein